MNSPFTLMARSLVRRTASVWLAETPGQRPPAGSRTEAIRQLLRDRGPLTGTQIALELDLPRSALVGALLKADLHCGRALHRHGRYEWNTAYDAEQAQELAAAARLLRRHGFRVERMTA